MARLDVSCVERGLTKSRASAQDAIKESRVLVNGKIITKPAFDVIENDQIEYIQARKYFCIPWGF